MATARKNIDQITRTLTSVDGTERMVGRDDTGDFKILFSNVLKNVPVDFSVGSTKFTVAAATGNVATSGSIWAASGLIAGGLSNLFTVDGSTGDVSIAGDLDLAGDFEIGTNKFTVAVATGNTMVNGDLLVKNGGDYGLWSTSGALILNDRDLSVMNNLIEKFSVDYTNGNTVIAGNLDAGVTTLTGMLYVNGPGIVVNTDTFAVVAATGNTAIAGTLDVAGIITSESRVDVTVDDNSAYVCGYMYNSSTGTGAGSSFSLKTKNDTLGLYFSKLSEDFTGAGNYGIIGNNEGPLALAGSGGNGILIDTDDSVDVTGNFTVATNKFEVLAASGNTSIAGTLAVAGISSFAAGAAATPSIARTGDLNTGIWFPAADTVAISTGGTERVRVNSSGKASMGTSTVFTNAQLSIVNSTGFAVVGSTENEDNTAKATRFGGAHYTNSEEPVTAIITYSDGTDNIVGVGGGAITGNAATEVRFYTAATDPTTSGTQRMIIDSSGNVGIGVTPEAWESPYSVIQVGGVGSLFGITEQAAGGSMAIASNAYYDSVNSRYEYIVTDEASMYFQQNGQHVFRVAGVGAVDEISWTNAITIDSSANVLIGGAAAGTSATRVLSIRTGTEPTSSPADMIQLYSVDLSAGNATLGIRTETAVVAETDETKFSHKLPVRINGATYYIMLTTT